MTENAWKDYKLPCGHPVLRSESRNEDGDTSEVRWVCTEGCVTDWIKIRKVSLPHKSELVVFATETDKK